MKKGGITCRQRKIEKHVDSYRIGNRKETSSFESRNFNKKGKIRKAHDNTGQVPQHETAVSTTATLGTFKPNPIAFGSRSQFFVFVCTWVNTVSL